ncbi:hypothetical protein BOTBODRAFT_178762 [Botryobasidium botryosum FD-172 SS1]|uniref:Uncharacterized protein n=1 Tax=Botryobasidium botryosum (strain FD-172 SS1) TaxID=930990 RepID=A0A067M283_BOTB1|nr:hypothetical protein BOTBODRAFT_178762 [Botryobasidium botryosum FD-172 SS1]
MSSVPLDRSVLKQQLKDSPNILTVNQSSHALVPWPYPTRRNEKVPINDLEAVCKEQGVALPSCACTLRSGSGTFHPTAKLFLWKDPSPPAWCFACPKDKARGCGYFVIIKNKFPTHSYTHQYVEDQASASQGPSPPIVNQGPAHAPSSTPWQAPTPAQAQVGHAFPSSQVPAPPSPSAFQNSPASSVSLSTPGSSASVLHSFLQRLEGLTLQGPPSSSGPQQLVSRMENDTVTDSEFFSQFYRTDCGRYTVMSNRAAHYSSCSMCQAAFGPST